MQKAMVKRRKGKAGKLGSIQNRKKVDKAAKLELK